MNGKSRKASGEEQSLDKDSLFSTTISLWNLLTYLNFKNLSELARSACTAGFFNLP